MGVHLGLSDGEWLFQWVWPLRPAKKLSAAGGPAAIWLVVGVPVMYTRVRHENSARRLRYRKWLDGLAALKLNPTAAQLLTELLVLADEEAGGSRLTHHFG